MATELRVIIKEWTADRVISVNEQQARRGLEKMAVTLELQVKDSLTANTYPPPSRPGEIPHKRTGILASDITREMLDSGLVWRVGTNLEYGRFLELGTNRMGARPFLAPNFAAVTARWREFFRKT